MVNLAQNLTTKTQRVLVPVIIRYVAPVSPRQTRFYLGSSGHEVGPDVRRLWRSWLQLLYQLQVEIRSVFVDHHVGRTWDFVS